MDKIKQVIIVRKDLNMRKGKIAAQVAHASMGAVLFEGIYNNDARGKFGNFSIVFNDEQQDLKKWLMGSFVKVVVSVNSEKELLDLKNLADILELRNYLIEDNGLTEFHGIKTRTALAIGPHFEEKFIGVTDKLLLL